MRQQDVAVEHHDPCILVECLQTLIECGSLVEDGAIFMEPFREQHLHAPAAADLLRAGVAFLGDDEPAVEMLYVGADAFEKIRVVHGHAERLNFPAR